MKLSQFNYDLPEGLIAEHPAKNRDESRLMVVNRASGKIEHKVFKDVIDYFDDGDVMVVNNTKVFPARLYGKKEKTGATIEVFLLRELHEDLYIWDVLVDPARKIRVGNKLYFGDDDILVAEVIDNTTSRGRTIRFIFDGDKEVFKKILNKLGNTPLPKYIKRKPTEADRERYQTLFAKHVGAVAAPTAGLHFSVEVIKRLQIKGCEFAELTLHTGLGSFASIDVEDLTKHKMEAEYCEIPQKVVNMVNEAKTNHKKVCSVGTTSMRALESSVTAQGLLKAMDGWTNTYIYPPYDFSIANSMVTNFHLPKSTLFIMICAFGGYDLMMEAYETAVKEKYRFFSYGDAMLIL